MKRATFRATPSLGPDVPQPVPSERKKPAADRAPAAVSAGKPRMACALLGLCLVLGASGSSADDGCRGDYGCAPALSVAAGAPVAHAPRSGHDPANLLSEKQCPGAALNVVAASADERGEACSAASDALRLLGRCGISLRRPLDVEITAEARHPLSRAQVFGFFDTKRERVLITREADIPSLVEGTPYAEIPRHDFYRSLIVHEVVHGIMHQNLARPAGSHAAYEYPAYALQIESLAPEVRDKFLLSFDQTAIRDVSAPLSDPILFFDPYFFAARAYAHFKNSNGCAHLQVLLERAPSFIVTMQ
jgi:hypothetical protein